MFIERELHEGDLDPALNKKVHTLIVQGEKAEAFITARNLELARVWYLTAAGCCTAAAESEIPLYFGQLFGAGERFRTVDLVLGKHTLYQLSYTRSCRLLKKSSLPAPPL